ncbi:DUF4197 domain-containing protein [Daejeonella oryzae]|uniref:DUF4197 domain-containing protein n=1 Tax=Daejeonella oryzae TaxID=1122943 RepID=UPI0003F6FADC|nr:DUF4197 domain-containing protein [Daejeonella oryzae]
MKLFKIFAVATSVLFLSSCETLNQAGQILNQTGLVNPTSSEISLGLKQALEFGTNYSSERLAAKDGYFGNMAVKILFPQEAQKVERTLRSLGLNSLADNVILSINRAAEDAAQEAKPIFISAIKQMTISDATNILLGRQNDAATEYFKRVTSDQLRSKFRPIIQSSLNKVGATRYWTDVINRYNQIPLVSRVNPDLEAYVTQKAIDGLFIEIAQEELKIRNNISARNTTLLQKVFGYADQNRKTSGVY